MCRVLVFITFGVLHSDLRVRATLTVSNLGAVDFKYSSRATKSGTVDEGDVPCSLEGTTVHRVFPR
jgi:hypothetical protein